MCQLLCFPYLLLVTLLCTCVYCQQPGLCDETGMCESHGDLLPLLPQEPDVALSPGTIYFDTITGFDQKYYTIDLARDSILDAVVVVDRGYGPLGAANASELCQGWAVYMTVNHTKPEAQPRYIERDRTDVAEILIAAFVQMQQSSILCNMYSCARWSVKDASPGRWWIMVQTRGGTEQYDNSTCRYAVWMRGHSRAWTVWGGAACLILFAAWALWTLALAFLPVLDPEFHVFRPSIMLHEFLLRLPADTTLHSVLIVWRLGKRTVRLLARRPRMVVSNNASLSRTMSGDDDQTELAVLVEPVPNEGTPNSSVCPDDDTVSVPMGMLANVQAPEEEEEGGERRDNCGIAQASSSKTGHGAEGSTSVAGTVLEASQQDGGPDEEEDCCRICGDNGAEEPLIEPCACQGSMRYVHATCLNKWRQESLNNGRHENALKCEVCHERFHIVHAPISCTLLCRSVTARVVKLLHYVVAYVLCAYLWSWLIKLTIGRWSCNAPFDAPSMDFGTEDVVFGILYYCVGGTHLYLAIYWQWVLWLNSLRVHNTSMHGAIFGTPKNLALVAYFCCSAFLAELGVGYIVKYFFFLFAENMVWIWDLPLTVGFLLLLLFSIVGTFVFVLWDSMGVWSFFMRDNLGVVTSRQL